MLDDKDIQKLIEVFATREEVATKTDLEEVRKDLAEVRIKFSDSDCRFQ